MSRALRIIIPGGNGHIGQILAGVFHTHAHQVTVLARTPAKTPWRTVQWDGATQGDWTQALENADVVINLAGRSVNCRYTAANRQAILQSRVRSTQAIGAAIAAAQRPPKLWLQASTATIYAHRFDAANNETTGILGGNEAHAPATWQFSTAVAQAWERAVDQAETPATRKIKMRTALVMAPQAGGPFHTLLQLVRLGLGGQAGNGKQFVSWIHHQDFVRAVQWLIDHPELQGAINLAAPNPLPNSEFMRALRRAWSTCVGLPAAEWMLSIGAFFMRTETELILKSRRVVPTRLLESGFKFRFPQWPLAAQALCQEWRERSR